MNTKSLLILPFMAFLILLLLPLKPRNAIAEDLECGDVVFQADLNACAHRHFMDADKTLNEVYKKARDYIKTLDDEEGSALKNFIAGQKGWIAYRDGFCRAYAGGRLVGGTMWPMVVSVCMMNVTKARSKELQDMIDEERG